MALSLLQAAWPGRTTDRIKCDDASKPVPDVFGSGPGGPGTVQRHSAQVSEILFVPWLYPVQQLLHDHHLSDASSGPAVELGTLAGDWHVCAAHMARPAFWFDAVSQVANRSLRT